MNTKLLGKKGITKKFLIVLNRSFDNIPDALEVIDGLDYFFEDFPENKRPEFVVFNKKYKVKK